MIAQREKLLATLRERIINYAASRVGRDAAEDLAQETLLLIEQKYSHLDAESDLLPVAITIMQYKMRAYHRKAWRKAEGQALPVDDVPIRDGNLDPAALSQFEQFKRRLLEAIAQLGGRCQDLFLLKMDGHSFDEIRIKLGANTIEAVYTWDFRCRKQLKQLVSGWE